MSPSRTVVVRLFAVLTVLGLFGLATGVAAPSASAEYDKQGDFAGPGGGDGEFVRPKKMVVQEFTGNLLVVDSGNDRVQVFAPGVDTATYLSQFGIGELDDPDGIAIDQASGAIYVSDVDQILKYDSSFVLDASWVAPAGVTGALAVDQASHDLLVADTATDTVKRYDADGSSDATTPSFDGSTSPGGVFTGLLDLASAPDGDIVVVDSATGSVADVVSGSSSRVERFHADGSYAQTLGPIPGRAGAVGIGQSAGQVFVAGNMDSYNNTEPLRVHVFDAAGSAQTDLPLQGPSSSLPRSTIWGVISGLAVTSDRLYVATDVDFVDNGVDSADYGAVTVQVHSIAVPAAPVATTGAADQIATTTASLRGTVDANYLSTKYWFEYGTTTNYGSEVPTNKNADAGAGRSPIAIVRALGNLQPATTYHYRLIAHNSLGTNTGADRTFTTASTVGDAAGDDRRYELVSPVLKGADVRTGPYAVKSSLDGNRVVFTANGAFAGAPSSPPESYYRATRTATGWRTTALSPPWDPVDDRAADPAFWMFSPDLSMGIVSSGGTALTPDAQAGAGNLYVRAGDEVPSYRLLNPGTPLNLTADVLSDPMVADASEDFSHVLIESPWPLTPDSPTGVATNVYESVNGQLRLASILPDGTPAQGAFTGPHSDANPRLGVYGGGFLGTGTMSADGSRLFFSDIATRELYVRINGTQTREVSASALSVPDPDHEQAFFVGATPDGDSVFFLSGERLTNASSADGVKLYRYTLSTSTLVDISADLPVNAGSVVGFFGASGDGSRAYLQTEADVYSWTAGSATKIATVDANVDACNITVSAGVNCGGARTSEVSPDGRYLLFASVVQNTDWVTAETNQVYRYDSATNHLDCVSCGDRATPSTGSAAAFTAGGNSGRFHGFHTTPMTRDGRVYFETRQALVDQDNNNHVDVYEWNEGRLSLISTGRGSDDAYIADVDPDGGSVFLTTRARLVPRDVDDLKDLYVARVGGGFPDDTAQAPHPCDGDDCQGGRAPSVQVPSVGSKDAGDGQPDVVVRARIRLKPIPKAARASLVRSGRTTVKATVTRAGTASLTVTARIARKTVTVSRSSAKAAKAGTVTLRISLSKSARAELRKRGSLRLSASLGFSGVRQRQIAVINLKKGR